VDNTHERDAALDVAQFASELTAIGDESTIEPTSPDGKWPAPDEGAPMPANLDLIMRIPVVMKIVIGSASLPVSALSKMRRGEVITLDRRAGQPADIVVNGRTIARGNVIVIDEATGQLGISIVEILGGQATPA
jgi:flagellar motor switch protein FliN